MENDVFTEKLKWFKENEKPEAVLVVGDDDDLIKIVVSWSNIDVRKSDKLSPFKGDSENEVWKWLWRNAKYSREELMDRSALHNHLFDSKLDMLIGNRVLYPDGTINSFVQRYLRERVLKLFEAKPRKAKQKSS